MKKEPKTPAKTFLASQVLLPLDSSRRFLDDSHSVLQPFQVDCCAVFKWSLEAVCLCVYSNSTAWMVVTNVSLFDSLLLVVLMKKKMRESKNAKGEGTVINNNHSDLSRDSWLWQLHDEEGVFLVVVAEVQSTLKRDVVPVMSVIILFTSTLTNFILGCQEEEENSLKSPEGDLTFSLWFGSWKSHEYKEKEWKVWWTCKEESKEVDLMMKKEFWKHQKSLTSLTFRYLISFWGKKKKTVSLLKGRWTAFFPDFSWLVLFLRRHSILPLMFCMFVHGSLSSRRESQLRSRRYKKKKIPEERKKTWFLHPRYPRRKINTRRTFSSHSIHCKRLPCIRTVRQEYNQGM